MLMAGDDIVICGENREKVKEEPEVEAWRGVKERKRGTRGTVKVQPVQMFSTPEQGGPEVKKRLVSAGLYSRQEFQSVRPF